MKKKLSVLILSCFLLSTPSFAHDVHHHKHKKPHHLKHHHFYKKPPVRYKNIYYYGNYSDATTENWAIITESVSNIVTTLFN